MARAANAFKEVRKTSLINRTLFYLEYRDILEEIKIEEAYKTIKYGEAIDPVRKVYMRYEEAAEFYSMSLTCFKALAHQAEAVRHYHSVALVNLDVIDLYIEENC